jgi:hypothetical protein
MASKYTDIRQEAEERLYALLASDPGRMRRAFNERQQADALLRQQADAMYQDQRGAQQQKEELSALAAGGLALTSSPYAIPYAVMGRKPIKKAAKKAYEATLGKLF